MSVGTCNGECLDSTNSSSVSSIEEREGKKILTVEGYGDPFNGEEIFIEKFHGGFTLRDRLHMWLIKKGIISKYRR